MKDESWQKLKQSEKTEVTTYFNGTGFERWQKIYSNSNQINKVQRNIRIGHQKTVDDVLLWIKETGDITQNSFCDAGCGVGSLSLPLICLGARSVLASDISEAMVSETKRRAELDGLDLSRMSFNTSDLESLKGSFNTVICLDVFIHYPQKVAEEMVRHLCSLSEKRLIVSFAPYSPFLALLKAIGQFFPGPSKTTRAYILRENGIVNAALSSGFIVKKRKLNTAPFYFSQLIQFEKQ